MNILKLIDAICEARENPDFKPRDQETHCNTAVNYVAERMGCTLLRGLVANQMHDLLITNSNWLKIGPEVAQQHANAGGLVIGAWKNPEGHGHVVIVRPGELGTSKKWNSDKVPKVLNIGTDIFIDKGANYAFQEMPDYFVLKSSI